ncbi:MAG: PmeII family type II restriction endonuclease [Pelolinea sp.]|nr:PmeII family type II restriction endonuclease [Pelolinea sp.]
MNKLNINELNQYVNENIVLFHEKRINCIQNLTLEKLIKKNPYLFKAKNIETANDLISGFLEAFLSSSEEKIFGDFLEGLAVFIAGETRNGHKSAATGIDLEIVENSEHHLISIKSGPNWGNSSQITKLIQDFNQARKKVVQQNPQINVKSILGICYGKTRTTLSTKGYWKLVGQNFWFFISGEKDLYTNIIEPIGFEAKRHNDKFLKDKNNFINKMTKNFIEKYCNNNGEINWAILVEQNSGNFDLDTIAI